MSSTLTQKAANSPSDGEPTSGATRRRKRSLRPGGRTLTFLGAFVIALSLLFRFYAYDRLAVIPADMDSTTVVQTPDGQDATIFDVSTLSERVTPLRQTVQVVGDPRLGEQASDDTDRKAVVWTFYTCTDVPSYDCGKLGGKEPAGGSTGVAPLSASINRVAYDRSTAQQIPWEGSFYESGGERQDRAVPKPGVDTKFPFGTTAKTYQVWDSTAQDTFPAEYVGKGELEGLPVLKFEMTVPPTKTSTIDIPGSLAGSDEASVTGDQMYSTNITYDVEPRTGVIIKRVVNQDAYIEVAGERAVTTTKATFVVTDDTVSQNVSDYKTLSSLLHLIHDVLPIWGTLVGAALVVGGGVLTHRRQRATNATS